MSLDMSSQASSWHMLDPAHDPERRSPRATRGSDENFHRPELSGSNSGSGRTRDLVSGSTSNDDQTDQRQRDKYNINHYGDDDWAVPRDTSESATGDNNKFNIKNYYDVTRRMYKLQYKNSQLDRANRDNG